jgi:predicted acylesterase/phospholipase RssA
MADTQQHKIGLALGSGSARGLAHIGIIEELGSLGIKPDIVCGTSIGALVGACYLCGHLFTFEDWMKSMSVKEIIRFIDIKLLSRGGVGDGGKLFTQLRQQMGDHLIENLERPFATVATDLGNGHEIWFTKGDLWNSVRASFAMPGLLKPVKIHDRWVVDGALVNPVPVSVCRALGADIIIAVNLNSDVVGRHIETPYNDTREEAAKTMALDSVPPGWRDKMSLSLSGLMGSDKEGTPGLLNVMATSRKKLSRKAASAYAATFPSFSIPSTCRSTSVIRRNAYQPTAT